MPKRTRAGRPLQGFTLVELMVVIAIISVLISMLLPALSKVRAAANTVACASNMRQICIYLQLYSEEHHDYNLCQYDPAQAPPGVNLGWVTGGEGQVWGEHLAYLYLAHDSAARRIWQEKLWRCPAAPSEWDPYAWDIQYGLNQWLSSGGSTGWLKRTQVRQPMNIIQIVDTAWYPAPGLAAGGIYAPGWRGDNIQVRHDKGINIGYMDGHVQYVVIATTPTNRNLVDFTKVTTASHPLHMSHWWRQN